MNENNKTPITASQTESSNEMAQPQQKNTYHRRVIIGIMLILLLVFSIISASIYKYLKRTKTTELTKSQIANNQLETDRKSTLIVAENIDEDGLQADTKEFQPFINYLVSQLKAEGITKSEFIGTTSVTQMTELVREGKIDVIIDSAFPVYVVDHLTGAQPLADRWKGGVPTYHSAIFVKKDSAIQTLDDLKGKMLAFDSTTSTVGYFLPKAELIRQGYTLTQKKSPTDSVTPNEIGYTFVHGNVYDSVAKGIVPAGAESELEIDSYFGDKVNNYRIIAKSPDILRFLVATRSDLDPSMTNALKKILFNMDKTPQGKSVLTEFADTAKFTPVNNTDEAYGEIQKLTNIVEQEIITQ